LVEFFFERGRISKWFCVECEHLWGRLGLVQNVQRAEELFDYGRPSRWVDAEKRILRGLIAFSGACSGRYLDFGVGGNGDALEEVARSEPEGIDLYGCDLLNVSNHPRVFLTYKDESKVGTFDGIGSSEVVEHLDDTIGSWTYFNRLLKPMAAGGGVMLHSFPSNVSLHLFDTMVVIGSHVCIFSEKSLRRVCERTGFEWLKTEYRNFAPEFYFQKVRDL
jgi:hypothetical protein